MGEEASVMSRTYVWERSVQMFKESPIWGYGFRSNEGYRRLINLNLGWGYFSHPHNYVLYVLMQGGVTLAGLIIALMLIISKKCIKMRTHFGAKILVFIYIAFFVMGISEALTAFTMLYPLAIFVDAFEKYEMEYRKRPRVKIKLR